MFETRVLGWGAASSLFDVKLIVSQMAVMQSSYYTIITSVYAFMGGIAGYVHLCFSLIFEPHMTDPLHDRSIPSLIFNLTFFFNENFMCVARDNAGPVRSLSDGSRYSQWEMPRSLARFVLHCHGLLPPLRGGKGEKVPRFRRNGHRIFDLMKWNYGLFLSLFSARLCAQQNLPHENNPPIILSPPPLPPPIPLYLCSLVILFNTGFFSLSL